MHHSERWIIKRDDTGKIREVKLIFNPEEYIMGKKPRTLYNQKELIKVLENDKAQ